MKVTDSRLDSIRSLVKKLKTEKTQGAEGVEGAAGSTAASGTEGAGRTGEVSAAGYGELHRAVEEQQLARDVELVLGSADPARASKVSELKARIEAGEYQVDADKVAARLAASGLFDEG